MILVSYFYSWSLLEWLSYVDSFLSGERASFENIWRRVAVAASDRVIGLLWELLLLLFRREPEAEFEFPDFDIIRKVCFESPKFVVVALPFAYF